MRSTAKVTYTDGHVDEAPLTPRVITSAEEHAQKEGWAPGEASKIRQSYYMAYLAQRAQGARDVGADFQDLLAFEHLQDRLGERDLVQPEEEA